MIVPGSSNALLLAQAGDPLDEFGKIERSVRFRSVAGGHLSRTPAAASNMKKGTFNTWVKKSGVGVSQALLSAGTTASTYFIFYWDTSDRLTIYGGNQIIAVSNPIYRDPAAHLNVNMVFDADNATALDRFVVEVDGARITSWQTYAPWTQGAPSPLNSAVPHNIGRDCVDGLDLLNGYLSNVAWVDGQALPSTAFGRFHPKTGQWRPKSRSAIKFVVDSGGINSFFLPFDDSTSLATLAADASSKGNNWTANNISLTAGATYDSLLDTPTNNFCNWSPIDNLYSGNTLSNGNLRVTTSVGSPFAPVKGTMGMSSGKWYWECQNNSSGTSYVVFGVLKTTTVNDYLGTQPSGYAYINHSGFKENNGTATAYGAPYNQGDIVGVALDMDNGTLTFYVNGVNQGVAFTGLSGTLFPSASDRSADYGGYILDANFGQRPFAYAPPAGFKALCTKNLPYPKIPNPQSAYVAVKQSGANVVAALSALSAWPAWIRLYKRLDGVEGWRWQFSDDSANYMDSASTAAKAAFPALTGASYVAHALRVSATNGIATGRLNHASGVADAVVDGLATTRKVIILKNEATGTWRFYHPDLTAGKLIYIESPTTAETTDPTINTVTSSGFTVDASLATGTYRWIALGEVAGFSKVGTYTTTGSADGPYVPMLGSPGFFFARLKAAGDLPLLDATRSPNNVANSVLYLSATDAEAPASSINSADFVSTGIKLRSATSTPEDLNYTSGLGVVFFSILNATIRYANAR